MDEWPWNSMKGLYGELCDPRPLVARVVASWGDKDAWEGVWAHLHHQGDVAEASYASIPLLVKAAKNERSRGWELYAFAAIVEVERHAFRNPALPTWMAPAYAESWGDLLKLALLDLNESADPLVVRTALAIVALAKGQLPLGHFVIEFGSDDEVGGILEDELAWSKHYRNDLPAPTGAEGM